MRAFLSHGWLPVVLPAGARRFHVVDPDLAYTFRSAGAALVSSGADVDIAPLADLSDEAPTAIVPIEGRVEGTMALSRVASRLAAYADVTRRGAQVRAALQARGYTHVRTVFWDRDQPVHFDAGPSRWGIARMAERFPRRLLVVASRHRPGSTLLEEALRDAAIPDELSSGAVTPLVSSGTLVVLTPARVLRIAIGGGTGLIAAQAETLEALRLASPSSVVATRIPEVVGTGLTGIAHWSIEQRMHGEHPPGMPRRSALFEQSLQFLGVLYRTTAAERTPPGAASFARKAEAVAGCLDAPEAEAVRDLSTTIDERIGMLERGFWHGDFWQRNLLVRGDQLVAVIDWAQGGPHGLPLLDLLNLELIAACDPDVYEWGQAFITHLLPRMARGPTDAGREYLRGTGLALTMAQHASLVAAYWLERVAHQIDAYADRSADPLWLQRNVIDVLHAITAQGACRPGSHEWSPRVASIAG